MDLLCICTIYDFFSTPENWKDYIIPFISPIIGVGGAYWIMKVQLQKQRDKEDRFEMDSNSLYRSTYLVNLKIVSVGITAGTKSISDLANRIHDIDYVFQYSELHTEGVSVILNQDYNLIYKSFRPTFYLRNGLLNDFVFSYNAVYTLGVNIKTLNHRITAFIEQTTNIRSELARQSSNLMTHIKLVLFDDDVAKEIKDFINTTYREYNIDQNIEGRFFEVLKQTADALFRGNQSLHLLNNSSTISLIVLL